MFIFVFVKAKNEMNLSRNNEPLSSLTAFIGLLLSIAGLVLLVVFAVLYGRTRHVVGFSIFGSGLILLYLVSAVYHLIPKTHRAKEIFRVLDHSMIYLFIASTYTPILLVLPQRGWGWSLFGVIWGLAGIGIALKIMVRNEKTWLVPLPYVVMGWLGIIALPILLKSLSPGALWWLMGGGVLYSLGIVFFVLGRVRPQKGYFGMHEVFHLFVIGASFSHFWLMFRYVLYL
ncbi:MAG: hemolysin III family protein [Candidatus Nealsonbacteria bacterium]|nr:hemolysin III family protein [Candidatus Nealsonbacteria bacterium]